MTPRTLSEARPPVIGLTHGLLPDRLTLGERNRLERCHEARKRVWWARLFAGSDESSFSEAPASFFIPPEKQQHGPEEWR